jgi:hypothetical protein
MENYQPPSWISISSVLKKEVEFRGEREKLDYFRFVLFLSQICIFLSDI